MQHQQHQQQPAGYRGTVTQIPCAAGVMVGGSTAPPAARLLAGATVTVSGLKAKPELNGKQGTVLSYDAAKERYNVSIASGAQQTVIALRPQNLV